MFFLLFGFPNWPSSSHISTDQTSVVLCVHTVLCINECRINVYRFKEYNHLVVERLGHMPPDGIEQFNTEKIAKVVCSGNTSGSFSLKINMFQSHINLTNRPWNQEKNIFGLKFLYILAVISPLEGCQNKYLLTFA